MAAIRKIYVYFEEVTGAVLLAAMCVVAVVQVVSRYIFASPPAWTEEMAMLLFAWLVFVGAALALKHNEHFAVDVLVTALPAWPRRIVHLLILILTLVFSGLLMWFGERLAEDNWTVKTAVLEIPRTWLYASVPFGGALMLVRTLEGLVRWWRNPPAEPAEPAEGAS